ncbi:hypothetical protein [Nocardioides taihuensis]|uniref:DUF4244 domain-containing protein n=1 Tax=Nocardioides taihuensis TaxID=1835606 RepID=A0ABW0BKD8_9ACTN
MNHLTLLLARCWLALTGAGTDRRDDRDERGDVPGWVLVTVMTAGLVAVIWGIADDELSALLRDALSSVSN